MKSLFLVLSFFIFAGCADNDPRPAAISATYEGNTQISKEQYNLALDKYLEAMVYNPFRPELHINSGLVFMATEQGEKAVQAFAEGERLAEKSQDKALLFAARFNKGVILGASKRVDEALEAYQAALEVQPDSIETKTNIELLLQGQGQGGGEGENQDQNQDPNSDKKDQKGDNKDQNKEQKDDDKQNEEEKEKKPPQSSQKYKPRPFDGKELSEGDVKKILGELKRQEEKIRAEYNKKERKEPPRDKDW